MEDVVTAHVVVCGRDIAVKIVSNPQLVLLLLLTLVLYVYVFLFCYQRLCFLSLIVVSLFPFIPFLIFLLSLSFPLPLFLLAHFLHYRYRIQR